MDEDSPPEAPPQGKPSQIPSWVSLGFVAGALFVLALPRRSGEPSSSELRPMGLSALPPASPSPPLQLSTIEAVFADWGSHAVWSNDVTEVALWDAGTKGFTDCYEVIRAAGAYYFRSIPRLTRPVLTHGVQDNSPLQFTETEQQRQEWLGDVRKQDWKDFSEGARQALGPPPVAPATAAPSPPPSAAPLAPLRIQIKPSDEDPRDR